MTTCSKNLGGGNPWLRLWCEVPAQTAHERKRTDLLVNTLSEKHAIFKEFQSFSTMVSWSSTAFACDTPSRLS